jgi:hypothetical protein
MEHPPELSAFLRRRKVAAGGLLRFGPRIYLLISTFMDPAPLQHHIDRLFHHEKEPGEVHWAFPSIPFSCRTCGRVRTRTVTMARFRQDSLEPLWSRYGHPASLTGGMWLATLFLPGTWNAAAVFTAPDHFFLYVALF